MFCLQALSQHVMHKRFAFIAKNLSGGGAEKVLLETASLLQQRGHQVVVLTLSSVVEHAVPKNLQVRHLNVVNGVTKALGRQTMINQWQAQRVQQALDIFQADVVISCNAEYVSRFVQHTHLYHWVHGVISGSKPRVMHDLQQIYQNASLICVAEAIREDIFKLGIQPKRCEVIYNPFDVSKIQRLAQAYVPKIEPPYLLHVGSFHPRKRHDRLLSAYQKSGVKIPLVLMGQGDYQPQIEAKIAELGLEQQVIILPFETNPYPYIQAASALLLSSDQEGLPTVLIESLVCGTPIVSVDCPSGPAEILTGNLRPFLVNLDDERALIEAISRIMTHPPKIKDSHFKKFTSQAILPQFEALA